MAHHWWSAALTPQAVLLAVCGGVAINGTREQISLWCGFIVYTLKRALTVSSNNMYLKILSTIRQLVSYSPKFWIYHSTDIQHILFHSLSHQIQLIDGSLTTTSIHLEYNNCCPTHYPFKFNLCSSRSPFVYNLWH